MHWFSSWGVVLIALMASRGVGATAEVTTRATASSAGDVAAQAAAVFDDYETANEQFMAKWQKASTDAERLALARTKTPDRKTYARRALDLARQHPADAGAVDAVAIELSLISQNMDPESVRLENEGLDLLLAHHLGASNLPDTFQWLQTRPSVRREAFLRTVVQKSSARSNRGRALLTLAGYFRQQFKFARRLKALPEFRDQIAKETKEYDRDVFNALPEDADKPLAETKSLYRQVAAEYPDVKGPGGSIADQATNILYAFDHLAAGNPAPQIEGNTIDGTPMKLSDYHGKVVMLDFWGDW